MESLKSILSLICKYSKIFANPVVMHTAYVQTSGAFTGSRDSDQSFT